MRLKRGGHDEPAEVILGAHDHLQVGVELAAGLEGHELVQPEAGGVDLVLECVARPAPAAPLGVAPLDHEALENPVENQPRRSRAASPSGRSWSR